MTQANLIDAFNDCVERLQTGQSIEQCLRRHPHHAEALRPMLKAGLTLRNARPESSAAARARVRSRVLHAIPVTTSLPDQQVSWTSRIMQMAAAFLFLFFVGIIFTMFNQDAEVAQSPPTNSPTVTLTASQTATDTPTPTATITISPTPSETPTATETALPTVTETTSPTATATTPPSPSPEPTDSASSELDCRFVVQTSSANLRNGPGLGYNVVDSGFEGESYPVTASHTSDEWLIVSVDGNLLWIAISVGEMIGDCDDLPISDTLLKDADSPTDEPDDDDEPDETDEPDDDDEPDDEEDEPEEPGDD